MQFSSVDTPNRETMAHLKALCFLRPTLDNLNLLKKELRKPKYGEYYICMLRCLMLWLTRSLHERH
jgi:hypothetical protein